MVLPLTVQDGRALKAALIILLLLALSRGVCWADEPLRATINETMTIDQARQEAFKDVKLNIDTRPFSSNSVDPNLLENLTARSSHTKQLANRIITTYQIGEFDVYSVSTLGDLYTYYYSSDGHLGAVEFPERYPVATSYPFKLLKYSYPQGDLKVISFETDSSNDYLFNSDGSLLVHWVSGKCFYSNGSSCGKRTSLK